LGLAYRSQSENTDGRGLAQAQAIRRRLGGSANMTLPFPPKPARMHWQTYWRLRREADAAGFRYHVDLLATMRRWDVMLGQPFDVAKADEIDAVLVSYGRPNRAGRRPIARTLPRWPVSGIPFTFRHDR
jgi:hypothetical protein